MAKERGTHIFREYIAHTITNFSTGIVLRQIKLLPGTAIQFGIDKIKGLRRKEWRITPCWLAVGIKD